jgi:hypothetical protein
VSGTVREPGDRTLSGVTVRSSSGATTITDAAGRFRLESIPLDARITAELAGYRRPDDLAPLPDAELVFLMVPDLKVSAGDSLISTVYWDDPVLSVSDDERCFPLQCPPVPVGPAKIIDVTCPRAGVLDTSVQSRQTETYRLTSWIQGFETSWTEVRAGQVVAVAVVLSPAPDGAAQQFELSTWIR